MTGHDSKRPREYVVAEYEAATAAYLHYDAFRWQSGSLLIAGAFVFLGLLAAGPASEVVDFGALLVAFVMSIWMLYAQHHRILYVFKLDRIAELEADMGAEQNLRFRASADHVAHYPRIGIPGHILDRIMGLGICLAGPALAVLKGSVGMYSLLALLVASGTFWWIVQQDRRALSAIA